MKKTIILSSLVISMLFFGSCQQIEPKEAPAVAETPKADMAKVKSDIQAIENEWADAQNKKDVNTLMALYTEDAQSMQDGGPTLSGKAAIQAQQEKDFAAPRDYATIAFQTQEVYGTADEVTEVGTSVMKDANGKEVGTGKYMAVYQKKDGKYKCVREIYNKDSK